MHNITLRCSEEYPDTCCCMSPKTPALNPNNTLAARTPMTRTPHTHSYFLIMPCGVLSVTTLQNAAGIIAPCRAGTGPLYARDANRLPTGALVDVLVPRLLICVPENPLTNTSDTYDSITHTEPKSSSKPLTLPQSTATELHITNNTNKLMSPKTPCGNTNDYHPAPQLDVPENSRQIHNHEPNTYNPKMSPKNPLIAQMPLKTTSHIQVQKVPEHHSHHLTQLPPSYIGKHATPTHPCPHTPPA